MRRREFIAGLSGVVAACPLAAQAQQGERVRRIGVLIFGDEKKGMRRAPIWRLPPAHRYRPPMPPSPEHRRPSASAAKEWSLRALQHCNRRLPRCSVRADGAFGGVAIESPHELRVAVLATTDLSFKSSGLAMS
jgi:hypothetical protein